MMKETKKPLELTVSTVSDKRKEQNRNNIAAFREKLAKEIGRKQRTYFTDDEDIENMNEIKKKVEGVKNQSDAIKYALAETVKLLDAK